MATASTGLCVRPSSNPSMGVAPPEGGDCSRLAADRLFLFLRFLLSQEAEDATPSPEPGSPEVDSTCTKAGGEPPKDDGAPTSGTAAPSCKSPATKGTKTWVVSSVTSDGPGTTEGSRPANANAPGNKALVGSNATSDGPEPTKGSNPANASAAALSRRAAALTSSKHCCGSTTAAALASRDGATPADATTGTADTVAAGCEGRSGHSLKRCPFWWQL